MVSSGACERLHGQTCTFRAAVWDGEKASMWSEGTEAERKRGGEAGGGNRRIISRDSSKVVLQLLPFDLRVLPDLQLPDDACAHAFREPAVMRLHQGCRLLCLQSREHLLTMGKCAT